MKADPQAGGESAMNIKRAGRSVLISFLLLMTMTTVATARPVVRYYADSTYPPYSYQVRNTMAGFDVELLQMIFSTDDYQLETVGKEWEDVLHGLHKGEADIISSLAKTAERESLMLFTDTTAKTSTAFFGLANRSFTLDQLSSYENRVGVGQDYSDEVLLREELGMENYRAYRNLNLAIQALLAGHIDLIFAEEAAVQYFLIQNQLQSRVTAYETDLFPREYHYGVSVNRPELVTFINQRMKELRAAGVYETLYQKYFFEPSPYELARQDQERIKTLILAGAAVMMMLVVVRYLTLRKQMQELQASNEQIIAMEQVLSDQVDQLQEHAKTIEYMAYHDDLTGLANVRALREYLSSAMNEADKSGTSIAFIIIDLDDFQVVNDMYGHQVGDQLIQKLANRLVKLVPEEAIVVRPGGDEYILCSQELGNRETAREFAENLLNRMQEPIRIEALTIHPCMSLGVAFYPEDAKDDQTLFAYADAAMYQAKRRGRNSYAFFSRRIYDQVQYRIRTEAELRRALENNEFELVYQPLVSAENESFCGMEALIRWRHPAKGMILPLDFIPIAEATGQIVAIGQWVLEEVCRQMHLWQREGQPPPPVSVNLSLKQLQDPDFVSMIRELLDRHEMPASQFKLEITETLAMQELKTVLEPLQDLKQMGAIISLDDFGTGFSSMSHLQNMPVQEVKIDKSFVWEMEKQKTQKAIVHSMIDLIHALDRKAVAEGVETLNQAEMLKSFGCDALQGYYYGMPMPIQELMVWAKKRDSQREK